MKFRRANSRVGGNVAVARYRTGTGRIRFVSLQSERATFTHAERALAKELARRRVNINRVKEVYSELEYCLIPKYCRPWAARTFPRSRLSWSFGYGRDLPPRSLDAKLSREAGAEALAEAVKGRRL